MLTDQQLYQTQAQKRGDVLIVEDDPTARRALRILVASRGYQTDAVSCGEDALAHVARGKLPNIALVDLDLPGMSGLDLLRQLDSTILPILITATAPDVVQQAFRDANIPVLYFQKPIDFEQLMTALDDHQFAS